MARQGSSNKRIVRERVHLDFLRQAIEWVVDQSIFQNLRTHGNTNWIAKDLVMLAVLWVWSEKSQLTAAFEEALTTKGKPTLILADTVKGKGVSFMEGGIDWHGKAPGDEETEKALAELGAASSYHALGG